MSNIIKGLNEGRNDRDSWDSNMPGYQGDYGGAQNFGRRKRDWDENDAIDARLRQQHAEKMEYEKSGKFWLKLKDSQRHLPAGPFVGKQAANTAALELLKQQPELKGNLLITAYGPDETMEESKEQEFGGDWDEKVKRLKQMAQQGERKTVWDPVKRVYKTVPVNPQKKEGVAEGGNAFMPGIENTPEYKKGFATGKLPVPYPEGSQQYVNYYKGVMDKAGPKKVAEEKCPHCGGPMFSDLLLAEKKDACYHKVRSRYKVWPSAYASGALVQCRKKGAANWGNKSKNEGVAEGDRPGMKDGRPYSDPLRRHPGNDSYMTPEYLIQKYQDELKKIAAGPYKRTKDVAMYKARIAKLQKQQGVAEEKLDEKCWPGYTRVRGVPAGAPGSCKKKTSESSILKGLLEAEEIDENLRKWFKEKWVRFGPDGKIRGACARGDDSEGKPKCLPQAKAHALGKKGRKYAASKKRREDPNPERKGPAKNVATKKKTNESFTDLEESFNMKINELDMVNEDWQKVNRKDKTSGMSRKAVKAYRRENPGSKLQTAVTTKPSKLKKGSKAAKRRKSFCARMKGMKKSRTSAKTKRDPNSNINKALRRWNCESIEQMQELIMIAEAKIAEAKNAKQQAAIAISKKKAKGLNEARDICNVCGQTPCNCTHVSSIMEGITK